MTLPFQQIPQGLLVPLFYAEVDPSRANTASVVQRTLLIGQMSSSGIANANVPNICTSLTQMKNSCGQGSLLALMYQTYRLFDTVGEVWFLPLNDNGAGAKASGSVTFGGPAAANGTLSFYIGGILTQTGVTVGMTATQVGAAFAAVINGNPNLPVGATAAAGVVTITADGKGEYGNDIDLRLNYMGYRSGEVTPAGLTVTIVAMAGGATNPVLTTALANLVDEPFDFIVSPYKDSTSTAAISALLSDNAGRWSWETQVYGHCFIGYAGSFSQLTTFGATLNDQHLTCIGAPASGPTPPWLWAAAVAASAAVSARADPAQPVQTSPILGVLPQALVNRFTLSQRQSLLSAGISTFRVDAANNVSVEKLVTTYQTNPLGEPDNSYQAIETMTTLTAVLRSLAITVTSQFARCKLAADGTRFAPGSNIVTPSIIRGALIAAYRQLEYIGLVQNSAAFAAGLIVQQNTLNPNRVDVLYPANLINQLNVFATLVQFAL
jgi:phage tail sheath gpL-like